MMLKIIRAYSAISFLLFGSCLFAQQNVEISGRVFDGDGEPIPGVNLLLEGGQGIVTDLDGKFQLSAQSGQKLTISFIGKNTLIKVIPSSSKEDWDIVLQDDAEHLDEVVLVSTGYGKRNKNEFTGVASEVSSDKFASRPVSTVDQALQGNVSGLSMTTSSGTPGAVNSVRIRGISSISAGNEPLYVIDGVPTVEGNIGFGGSSSSLSSLASLNSEDIESITVLKDASATAAYGARGANGVIVITTKSGSKGKPSISYSANIGFSDFAVDGPELLSSQEWADLSREAFVNSGRSLEYANQRIEKRWDGKTNTDWKDLVTNDFAVQQQHTVSARGRTKDNNTSYYMSLGYRQFEGIVKSSGMDVTTAKLNFSHKFNDYVKVTNNLTVSYNQQRGLTEGQFTIGGAITSNFWLLPIYSPYDSDNQQGFNALSVSGKDEPNALALLENDRLEVDATRILNNTALNINTLFGVEYLNYTFRYAIDRKIRDGLVYRNRLFGGSVDEGGSITRIAYNRIGTVMQNMLDYRYMPHEDHKLDFKVLVEYQKDRLQFTSASGEDFVPLEIYQLNVLGKPTSVNSGAYGWSQFSSMAMVNYAFQSNKFLDLTYRSEGSSKFADGHRFGNFYSVGTSWILSKESFMDVTKDYLSFLKLRFSTGLTGNSEIGNYEYLKTLSYSSKYLGKGTTSPSQLENLSLTWEKAQQFDLGVDFGFFDGKLSGSVTAFLRKNHDLLQSVPLSRTTGFSSLRRNVGEAQNRGLEFELSGTILKLDEYDFLWTMKGNFTILENEVLKLGKNINGDNIEITGTNLVRVGEPIYAWNLPQWAGVDPDNGDPLWWDYGTPQPGGTFKVDDTYTEVDDLGRYRKKTNDYNEADRVSNGYSALPTRFGSISTSFEYKGIYLNADLYYSGGNKIYDSQSTYSATEGESIWYDNQYRTQLNRWQKKGDITDVPKIVMGGNKNSRRPSTRFLYDGDFLRLTNVTLGYRIPKDWLSYAYLNSASIYVKFNNYWTYVFDERLQYDAEVDETGYISFSAPVMKAVVFGLNVTL